MEVTVLAITLGVIPYAYTQKREQIATYHQQLYNKLFAISDKDYELAKKRQIESIKKE